MSLSARHYQIPYIVTLGLHQANLTEVEQAQRSYVPTSFEDPAQGLLRKD